MEELKKYLEGLAKASISTDHLEEGEDFMVYDQYGGNIDDAYQGGYHHGEVELARHILKEFLPTVEKPVDKFRRELVGKYTDVAINCIKDLGMVARIVKIDGHGLVIARDMNPNRINLEITDGRVSDLYLG